MATTTEKTTSVSMAYLKAHLPQLMERVARGERITIVRYKQPVAELGPTSLEEKPKPKFGTLKGKVKPYDPKDWAPMTDEEVDAFIEGRY